ncbi:ER degradation-enhancing alpha-mannosidase-like protein 1 [Physcia stellaris]|nr:ER degradation-enhancing alpha-mannosidase-like protein 1 [Physcia stellaris]
MFYHGYENYIKHAFPEDELRPLTCKPLTRDRANPAHIELNDALGNYSLTLIDSLSTLAILASSPSAGSDRRKRALDYFQTGVAALVEQYGDGSDGPERKGARANGFDVDSKVQVFETVIRGVGGLLSAHLFAVGELPMGGYTPSWSRTEDGDGLRDQIQWANSFNYNGQLLRLALDLATRLLPAFQTATGIPYPRVNLRDGVPFYSNSPLNQNAETGSCRVGQQSAVELTETCSAGAGSLVLEFTTLSRLTGLPIFEQAAKRAFWSIWERRSAIGLIGSGIDAESGQWTSPYTGIGAGIDSFFEYAAKSYILLSGAYETDPATTDIPSRTTSDAQELPGSQLGAEDFLHVWEASHSAITRHLRRGDNFIHPHYIQGDLYTGAARGFWFDSLSAFYPGLLTLTGKVEEATQAHLLLTALWTRYSALPERWSVTSGSIEGGLNWWGGRPEFIESTYYLYRATKDPWYLHVGEMVLRDIKRRCWAKCGWAGIQDVRTGERSDRMESFFLGETTKYLMLLFDPDHPLNNMDSSFVFSTEGHPLILPRPSASISPRTKVSRLRAPYTEAKDMGTCSVPPSPLPFTLSATAARRDVFHAANLARLHLMPKPENIESPLVEYSSDHPSISMSDVRSPSNYTYFPWTLPPELVPWNATCSVITPRPTFDITFPSNPSTVLSPGTLQRVLNGILINSMSGIRFGMIQDSSLSTEDGSGDLFRVQAINNILLGKDEKVFLPREVISDSVSPQDPNFERVRDTSILDLVIDIHSPSTGPPTGSSSNTSTAAHPNVPTTEDILAAAAVASTDMTPDADPSPILLALSSLFAQMHSLLPSAYPPAIPSATPPSSPAPLIRKYIPAILPTGLGAAPLPDVEEALGPDIAGNPQGTLIYSTVHVTDINCDTPLSASIVKTHQVLVLRRGVCSFSRKLQNIPSYAPSRAALQLVIIVSAAEDDDLPEENPRSKEDGVSEDHLIRPLLDTTQTTPKGLPRRNPIPMVMVGGGETTMEMFRTATGVGVKRRWRVRARGWRWEILSLLEYAQIPSRLNMKSNTSRETLMKASSGDRKLQSFKGSCSFWRDQALTSLFGHKRQNVSPRAIDWV